MGTESPQIIARAHFNAGQSLFLRHRFLEAIAPFAAAIALDPELAAAHLGLGRALAKLKKHRFAIFSFDRALQISPADNEILIGRATSLSAVGQCAAALCDIERVQSLHSERPELYGLRLEIKLENCDWSELDANLALLTDRLACGDLMDPFSVLCLTGSPELQLAAARSWINTNYAIKPLEPSRRASERHRDQRIHVAYFSADFGDHAVSTLAAELFELHDRNRFHVTAFSFGVPTKSAMRHRIAASVDQFIDVQHIDSEDVVDMAHALGVDIAIDLGGLTANCRTELFAMRCAPVQVSYLGFPATMGADFIDYIIADPHLIPSANRFFYSEKIAYLPSYQANDRRRPIPAKPSARLALGLPASGFIYCCFNQNLKFNPATFAVWMRILTHVPTATLLLFAEGEAQVLALRREATQRGVAASRLVFGRRLPTLEYLARYQAADLFLDTLPFNAGATASDALWAGLPVLTCTGEAFASRMGSSLLHAVGLPELVTSTLSEYESLAVALANDPPRMARIRGQLTNARRDSALFATDRFTANLERAYERMHQRHVDGLPPDHIEVLDSTSR